MCGMPSVFITFFETVIEACLDSLLSVWVKFRVHKESLIFCMEVESNANLTSFFEITDTMQLRGRSMEIYIYCEESR